MDIEEKSQFRQRNDKTKTASKQPNIGKRNGQKQISSRSNEQGVIKREKDPGASEV